MREVPKKLSLTFLVVLLGVCVYRAKTQSFAVDEAFVFLKYVNTSISAMLQSYDACNHVLHTLLTKLFRGMLGNTEIVLRLSSLLGAALYFSATYRLTGLLFQGWAQLVAAMLLTLNPLVLDFMVASRGYGLALGLYLWALYCVCSYFIQGYEVKWLRRAGVLAGLSIGANLTMLVPCAALGMALLVLAFRDRKWWTVVDCYGGPAVTLAFLINVLPLAHASSINFYYGTQSIREALDFLTAFSLVTREELGFGKVLREAVPVIGQIIVPALVVVLMVGTLVVARHYLRRPDPVPYHIAPLAVFSLTTALSITLILVMHWVAGVLYPLGRTALYLVPLAYLTLVACGRWYPRAAYGLALLLIAAHLAQFEMRFFLEWRWDASINKLVDRMSRHHAGSSAPVTVNVSALSGPAFRYYLVRRNFNFVAQINTRELETRPADYYVLSLEDRQVASKLGLEVLMDDPVSGAMLAVRR